MIDLKSPESISLIIPLYTIDDDLRYEGDCWQDQSSKQNDQRQVEMLQSEDLQWLF